MPDLVNLLGMREDAALAIANHRVLFPASLQQFVDDFKIFVGDLITIVVPPQTGVADVLGAAFEIGSHDVPADPPLGMMIRRRNATGESVGMFERGRSGDANSQMFRRKRDGRGELDRIVDRNLRRLLERMIE